TEPPASRGLCATRFRLHDPGRARTLWVRHSHPQSHSPAMNRRVFVKTTAAVAVTASAGPTLLGTTRKAGDDNPVIGTGEHRYQCFHDWGELPADYALQTTHNVAIDSQG